MKTGTQQPPGTREAFEFRCVGKELFPQSSSVLRGTGGGQGPARWDEGQIWGCFLAPRAHPSPLHASSRSESLCLQ